MLRKNTRKSVSTTSVLEIEVPKTTMKEVEKMIILESLKIHKQNRTHTARSLGIHLRTVQRRLKEYKHQHFLKIYSSQKDCKMAIKQRTEQIKSYAAHSEFEKAAILRDEIKILEKLIEN